MMRVLVTCIGSSETGDVLRALIKRLEPELASVFSLRSLGSGVDEVVLVAISVAEDPEANARRLGQGDGFVKYSGKDGKVVSAFQIGVLLAPSLVAGQNLEAVRELFLSALLDRLDRGLVRPPADFDIEKFASLLRQHVT
ncbi:MAG: hypothetical protein ACK5V8_01230 [Betaproteobacteria bacterium]|jgi:hypothetical protein